MTVFAFYHPWLTIVGLMALSAACLVAAIAKAMIIECEACDDPLAPLPDDDIRAAIAGDFAAEIRLEDAACAVGVEPNNYTSLDSHGLPQTDWQGLREATLAAGVAAPNDEDFARLEREHSAAVFRLRKGRSRET